MPVEYSASRRLFLKNLGVSIALPFFESQFSAALAKSATAAGNAATTASGMPLRMAFVYIPNGVNQYNWWPHGEGTDFRLNETMANFRPFQKDLQLFTGFEHWNANALGDGAGGHARASACFLTGCHPVKTAGANIRVGVSADQIAAKHIGHLTRLPSLELSTNESRRSGNCDNGYSCAYQYNLSWRTESSPAPAESKPRLVFERLYGSGDTEEYRRTFRERMSRQQSILDFVLEDAKSMRRNLGRTDQAKLDEYLVGIRELEERIEKSEQFEFPDPTVAVPNHHGNLEEHISLMIDLMVSAFQTDSTRIATFSFAPEVDDHDFSEIGVGAGHHYLSHHQENTDKLEKIGLIDRFYADRFAYFMERMKAVKDPDGTSLLHNSMVVYGSGISDGDRHNYNPLPIVLAGHGGGRFTTGRHIDFRSNVPLTNLYVSMFQRMGVPVDRMGDSTGVLKDV